MRVCARTATLIANTPNPPVRPQAAGPRPTTPASKASSSRSSTLYAPSPAVSRRRVRVWDERAGTVTLAPASLTVLPVPPLQTRSSSSTACTLCTSSSWDSAGGRRSSKSILFCFCMLSGIFQEQRLKTKRDWTILQCHGAWQGREKEKEREKERREKEREERERERRRKEKEKKEKKESRIGCGSLQRAALMPRRRASPGT